MLRQVNVNLPFTEVLSQMLAYAMLLKEILTKQRKMEETSVVKLTEHCSEILQNKFPQRCSDPGSFTIPYSLGNLNFDKSLRGSVASINILPLYIYRKLENEIEEIRSAPVSLQLADQTSIIPEGVVEDVLVRVATGRGILDIYDRKLMLRVDEENVTFEMNVETWVRKEKPAASVEWKVKSSKENSPVNEKDKYAV
ncbi:uncharacterized protein [Nicotiana sylvestris]|uniref:uncharacterized protein n=1 Tax=Nicotiana sylvestris TaxID=4096 RepID=UPI00388C38C7